MSRARITASGEWWAVSEEPVGDTGTFTDSACLPVPGFTYSRIVYGPELDRLRWKIIGRAIVAGRAALGARALR